MVNVLSIVFKIFGVFAFFFAVAFQVPWLVISIIATCCGMRISFFVPLRIWRFVFMRKSRLPRNKKKMGR